METCQVLIVDDEPYIVESIETLVRAGINRPLEIHHAYNGASVLALFQKQRIDIAVCDIRMPGFDGLQLSKMILDYWPHCRIMLLTAYADFDFVREALSLGICAYVLKTDSDEQILSAFRKCLQQFDEQNRQIDTVMQKFSPQRNMLNRILHRSLCGDVLREELGACGFRSGTVAGFYLVGGVLRQQKIIDEKLFAQMISSSELMPLTEYRSETCLYEGDAVWLWQLPEDVNDGDFREKISGAFEKLAMRLSREEHIECIFCIGSRIDDADSIPEAFQQLKEKSRAELETGSARRIVKEIERCISEHSASNLSVYAVASMLGYNASYLSRLYQKETGRTIYATITDTRLKYIKKLMREWELSLSEIAERAGFETQSYFNRFIRRTVGMTPGQLRHSLKKH